MATHPNWVTTAWRRVPEVLDWQWQCRAIPYWREAAGFAAEHGVKWRSKRTRLSWSTNVETALRPARGSGPEPGRELRSQPPVLAGCRSAVAIRALGNCDFPCSRQRDVALDPSNVAVNGVIDAKSYHLMADDRGSSGPSAGAR